MPKKILLYTRPIAPPWNEASKNLAWDIAKNSSNDFQFNILTTKQKGVNVENITEENPLKKRKGSERFQDFLDKSNNDKITLQPIFSSADFRKKEKFQLLRFLQSLRPKNFDIIHFPFTPRPLTSFLIKRKLKKLDIKSIQTIATLDNKFYKNSKKLKKLLFADEIIAQSSFTFDKLKKSGIKNIKLVYPAINFHRFYSNKKDARLMRKFSIDPDDFVILFPGEYFRLKAIDDIVKAFSILMSYKLPATNYKLILACRIKSKKDKKKQAQIKKQAKENGLDKNIVFIETFSDMPKLFNLSDLVIFPVREMTGKFDIPLALIEAMACKKPVLISNISMLREFIKDSETGFVVPKAQPEKLALKIRDISQNKEIADKIARKGFDFALANFDIQKNVKKYEEIYKNL